MIPIFRAVGAPLIIAAATLCFSVTSGWACDNGGCNNRPSEIAPDTGSVAVPQQELVCSTNECVRPDTDATELMPIHTASCEGGCNNSNDDTSGNAKHRIPGTFEVACDPSCRNDGGGSGSADSGEGKYRPEYPASFDIGCGTDNCAHPDAVEPLQTACSDGSCNDRPDPEDVSAPEKLACMTVDCLRPETDAVVLKPLITASCGTSNC